MSAPPVPATPQASPRPAAPAGARGGGAWTAFLVMAFAVVGMTGVLGTFAAQVPLERAMARSAALDATLLASRAPDPAAALERLRPDLGESADAVLSGPATPEAVEARVAAERRVTSRAVLAESADTGFRLRVVICVFAAAGALFGSMVLSVVRRGR